MAKYEIYQLGKLPPLTVVEADNVTCYDDVVKFSNSFLDLYGIQQEKIIAIFNWENIAGYKKLEIEDNNG